MASSRDSFIWDASRKKQRLSRCAPQHQVNEVVTAAPDNYEAAEEILYHQPHTTNLSCATAVTRLVRPGSGVDGDDEVLLRLRFFTPAVAGAQQQEAAAGKQMWLESGEIQSEVALDPDGRPCHTRLCLPYHRLILAALGLTHCIDRGSRGEDDNDDSHTREANGAEPVAKAQPLPPPPPHHHHHHHHHHRVRTSLAQQRGGAVSAS